MSGAWSGVGLGSCARVRALVSGNPVQGRTERRGTRRDDDAIDSIIGEGVRQIGGHGGAGHCWARIGDYIDKPAHLPHWLMQGSRKSALHWWDYTWATRAP